MMENGNIRIMGYYFKMENVQVDVSSNHYSLNTTKIFNGTEINTRGEWNGIQFSFDCYIQVKYKERNKYDKIFKQIMSRPVEIISQDFTDIHYGMVVIKKQPITGNPNGYLLNISIKEVPLTSDYYADIELNEYDRERLVKS